MLSGQVEPYYGPAFSQNCVCGCFQWIPFFSFAVRGQGVSENGIFVEKTSSPSVMIDLVLTDLFWASMDFKLQNLPDPTMDRETVM